MGFSLQCVEQKGSYLQSTNKVIHILFTSTPSLLTQSNCSRFWALLLPVCTDNAPVCSGIDFQCSYPALSDRSSRVRSPADPILSAGRLRKNQLPPDMCMDPEEGSMISLDPSTKYTVGSMISLDPMGKGWSDL